MDPIISCMDSQGKASGFGGLKGGTLVECSPSQARALMGRPPPPLLAVLGAKFQFEMAVGVNGRVWVSADSVAATAKIANILMHAQTVPLSEQEQWVKARLQ
eukprot:GHRR01035400.1.p1 GENE.GHRR01035400.1~~GHRR01035400.1.p1  ORF type:complete len:102 (+),score=15.80 GHRR01035400.1:187-492(+)